MVVHALDPVLIVEHGMLVRANDADGQLAEVAGIFGHHQVSIAQVLQEEHAGGVELVPNTPGGKNLRLDDVEADPTADPTAGLPYDASAPPVMWLTSAPIAVVAGTPGSVFPVSSATASRPASSRLTVIPSTTGTSTILAVLCNKANTGTSIRSPT